MNEATDDPAQGEAYTRLQALVDALREAGYLASPSIEGAFRAVPRHLFLPGLPLERVYADEAVATKKQDGVAISSSSQPAVMAIMLEQLDLQPGQRVLEIGAGTGYNAGLMAHIVGAEGRVVTIDIDDDLVAAARAHLGAAGVSGVEVVRGDGADGYPDAAPYDRIILTVGAGDIAPAWIAQLKPDGRLVLPLSLEGNVQKLVAFERSGDHLASVSLHDGGFMKLRGSLAGPETQRALGPTPGLLLRPTSPRALDADALYALLTGPSRSWPTSVRADGRDVWGGVSLWLALHASSMCGLTVEGEAAASGLVPHIFAFGPVYRATVGLCGPQALAILTRPHDGAVAPTSPSGDGAVAPTSPSGDGAVVPASPSGDDNAPPHDPLRLWVQGFGEDDSLARALVGHLTAWEAAGRPSTAGLQIRAYPIDAPLTPNVNAVVIVKEHTRLVLDRPSSPRR